MTNPFNGQVLAEVAQAAEADIEQAVASTTGAASAMAVLASHARYNILQDIAALIYRRREEFASTITAEAGKPIADGERVLTRTNERRSSRNANREPAKFVLQLATLGPLENLVTGFC